MLSTMPSGPRIAIGRGVWARRDGVFTANKVGSQGNRACSAAQFFQPANHGIG